MPKKDIVKLENHCTKKIWMGYLKYLKYKKNKQNNLIMCHMSNVMCHLSPTYIISRPGKSQGKRNLLHWSMSGKRNLLHWSMSMLVAKTAGYRRKYFWREIDWELPVLLCLGSLYTCRLNGNIVVKQKIPFFSFLGQLMTDFLIFLDTFSTHLT